MDLTEALGALIRERRLGWYALARSSVSDPQLAEDCLQEALLLAWRHRHQVRDAARLDAWVRRILLRICRHHRASRAEEPLVLETASAAEDEALSRWSAGTAIALIEALPPRQRAAVLGRLVEDLPYSSIATGLECSEATARSLVRFGIHRLRPAVRAAIE